MEKGWKDVFPIRGEKAEREQKMFLYVSLQLLGSSSLMSLVITYHSLAIDCESPSDLQRSSGVMVGKDVERREEGMAVGYFGGILIIGLYEPRRRIWSLIRFVGYFRGL